MQQSTPQTFGRYRALSLLGEGAMGRVYLAEDPVLQRKLAIKVIALDEHLDQATVDEYLKRFSIEARASARLNHPSIVTIHDAGEENGVPWIAFEFVDGERLDHLLRREAPLPIPRVVSIAHNIASALSLAHSAGVIHRDIKPANILLDKRNGIAKLSDFGIVKAPWTTLTQEGNSVGSPGYMSPEQIDGTGVDTRSDIFSLGVVIYEMVSGKHPFVRNSVASTFFATVSGAFTPIHELRPDIPGNVKEVIERSLRVDRNERFGSISELIALLGGHDQSHPGDSEQDSISRKNVVAFAGRLQKIGIRTTAELHIILKIIFRQCRALNTKLVPALSFSSSGGMRTAIEKCSSSLKRAQIVLKRATGSSTRSLRTAHRKLVFKFGKRSVIRAYVAAAALICSLSVSAIIFHVKKPQPAKQSMFDIGEMLVSVIDNTTSELLDECRGYIDQGKTDAAFEKAQTFAEKRPDSGPALVMLALAELGQGNYESADSTFSKAHKLKDGSGWIRRETNRILNVLEKRLGQPREAPPSLIALTTNTLSLGRHRKIRQWTHDERYWVRWNAVRIRESAGANVDMVKVYILDLHHGGSMRTRIRAAEKLGELGDKRAVPELEKVAMKGFRDPFVSATASSVLEKKFR